MLAESWGNIAQAADALGIPTRDFRFMVRMTPALTAVAEEASELFCDRAEGILSDALESENEVRRDVASRFVLSGKGAPRGWTRPSSPAVIIDQQLPRQVAIKWLDEDETEDPGREMDVIERDGKTLSVPRHSRGCGDDCVEGEVATPAVLIEHQDVIAPEPVAPMPTLPVWPGPYPPPPLVSHLYTYAPPQRGLPPQPGMSAPSRRRAVRR